jgi:Zn-dependent protease
LSSSIRLGRMFGIPIFVHYTWFIIFVLVTLTLARGFFPNFHFLA